MITPRNIFLIDGLGALTTAILLSQVLARLESVFGMPKNVLYVLAAIALAFAVYSLLSHAFIKSNYKLYLKGIIIANSSYCLLTPILVLFHYSSVSILGIAYFAGEILVVLALVYVEYHVLSQGSYKIAVPA